MKVLDRLHIMLNEPGSITGTPKRRFARRLARSMLLLAMFAGATLAYGFLEFVSRVGEMETEVGQRADGVIALTGGAERIADALSVLAEGRARRLLITGVFPQTSDNDLIRQAGHVELFQCCVDVDRQALNTVGNALEASRWVAANAYRSLIVVTSSYHMPRAMLELRRRMPEIEIIPHPVVTDGFRAERWWHEPANAKVLIWEYAKLLGAQIRRWFFPKAA